MGRLLKGRGELRPYERAVMDGFASGLGDEARVLLRRQTDTVDGVHRLVRDREVNLYARVKPVEAAFPRRRPEELLATVSLAVPGEAGLLKAHVWVIQGRVFSLVFNAAPGPFVGGRDPAAIRTTVRVWANPMEVAPVSVEDAAGASSLTGRWAAMGRVGGTRTPLPRDERESLRERLETMLPPDYVELQLATDGFRLKLDDDAGCDILGLGGIREVAMEEVNFFLLAEIQGARKGALGVKIESQDGNVYFLDYEDETIDGAGSSFQAAVERWLKPYAS